MANTTPLLKILDTSEGLVQRGQVFFFLCLYLFLYFVSWHFEFISALFRDYHGRGCCQGCFAPQAA
jgi:hypothetical protein